MEADFVRHYGKSLAAEVQTAGLRKLSVLVHGLPRDSVTWSEETRWTNRDEMQALTIELLDRTRHDLIYVQTGKRVGEPISIDRPDSVEAQEPKKELTTDPGEIARFFGRYLKD